MKLTVTTPLAIVVEVEGVRHVRAEDASGAFGILGGHADFLTALAISVLSYRDANNREHYVAVRGGMLRVLEGERILVATPEAFASDDLKRLESEVLVRFHRDLEAERTARTDAERLRLAAIRQVIHLLRPDGRAVPRARMPLSSSTEPER